MTAPAHGVAEGQRETVAPLAARRVRSALDRTAGIIGGFWLAALAFVLPGVRDGQGELPLAIAMLATAAMLWFAWMWRGLSHRT